MVSGFLSALSPKILLIFTLVGNKLNISTNTAISEEDLKSNLLKGYFEESIPETKFPLIRIFLSSSYSGLYFGDIFII